MKLNNIGFYVDIYDVDGLGKEEHYFNDYQDALHFFDSLDEEDNKDIYRKMTLTEHNFKTKKDITHAIRKWHV